MNQQDEEILVMDYFRNHFEDFPKGKLIKSESPDFILKVSHKKFLGIELTRLDDQAPSLKERIQKTLENKNQKIHQYQNPGFYAFWLIIYADCLEESKTFNIQNKLNPNSSYLASKLFRVFYNQDG